MAARFPHTPPIRLGVDEFSPESIIERLGPYLTEERRARIERVVMNRTYSVVPVLEGVHDLGNVNAVMRSAEGLGYAAAHLVALQGDAAEWAGATSPEGPIQRGLRTAQRQSQGADKWLDLHVWHDVPSACEHLRGAGYRIVATHLGADSRPITEFDFSQPTAIVLGNEADGVSGTVLAEADATCALPIEGFIQSYNVSVAAALALYHARSDRLARLGGHGDLDERERLILTAAYYLRAARHAEALLGR